MIVWYFNVTFLQTFTEQSRPEEFWFVLLAALKNCIWKAQTQKQCPGYSTLLRKNVLRKNGWTEEGWIIKLTCEIKYEASFLYIKLMIHSLWNLACFMNNLTTFLSNFRLFFLSSKWTCFNYNYHSQVVYIHVTLRSAKWRDFIKGYVFWGRGNKCNCHEGLW